MTNTNTDPKRDIDAIDDSDNVSETSRRTIIKTVGVLGAISGAVGLGGLTLGQSQSSTIRLGGATSGWGGRAPSSIEGTTNPTLTLQAGTEYDLIWENVDGAPHNVVINSSEGEKLVRSEIVGTEGETQTVTFVAKEGMSEYLCEVHPTTMVGDVEVETGDNADAEQNQTETTGNETTEVGNRTGERVVGGNQTEEQAGNETGYNVSEGPIQGERIVGPGNETNNSITGPDAPSEWTFEEAPNGSSTNATAPVSDTKNGDGGKGGNGKAKSGNGKAKSGNGNQTA